MAITITGGLPETHYGEMTRDGSFLTYGPDKEGNEARQWVSGHFLTPENIAAMLAGCYKITRPAGKKVFKPRNEVFPDCECIDLRSAESLQDPRVVRAIFLLDDEGSDTSPIHLHAATLAGCQKIVRSAGKKTRKPRTKDKITRSTSREVIDSSAKGEITHSVSKEVTSPCTKDEIARPVSEKVVSPLTKDVSARPANKKVVLLSCGSFDAVYKCIDIHSVEVVDANS